MKGIDVLPKLTPEDLKGSLSTIEEIVADLEGGTR